MGIAPARQPLGALDRWAEANWDRVEMAVAAGIGAPDALDAKAGYLRTL
jgi:hypothetical protein